MEDPDIGKIDFNSLITEIESGTGGSIAAAIRKLREHELAAYKLGVGGPTGELVVSFIDELKVKAHERLSEIEDTCARHYQGFLEAAKELLATQNEASRLQNCIREVNENLKLAVKTYSGCYNELSDCKNTLAHIDQCMEALTLTIPILDQYARVEQSISEGRFYHALRLLEDLGQSQLVSARQYAFSELMRRRIPQLRAAIKNSSLAELTDFLESVRKNSIFLGVAAMRETAKAMGMNAELLLGSGPKSDLSSETLRPSQSNHVESSPNRWKLNDETPAKLRSVDNELDALSLIATDQSEDNLSLSLGSDFIQPFFLTDDQIDFGPVYRCLHIHSVLHERAEFERHYCAQRRKQCQLLLSLTVDQQRSMRNYGEFFGAICGFFVVDDHLRHTLSSSSASYQTYLDELWDSTVERLVEFARANGNACQTPEELIRLKEQAVLFSRTMGNLGFCTTALSEMTVWIQQSYQRLLIDGWRDRFDKIIKADNLRPILISSPDELPRLSSIYPPCMTAEFMALSYPRQLCFSWMVPQIYQAIREYIDLFHRFCSHTDMAISEIEDTVNRATNSLFIDCLNVVLNATVRQFDRQLPHLLQFCTNLEELETACGHLDHYLTQMLPTSRTSDSGDLDAPMCTEDSVADTCDPPAPRTTSSRSPQNHLCGSAFMKDLRDLVESFIRSHLNTCVDEFIGMIDYTQLTKRDVNGVQPSDRQLNAGSELPRLKPNEHIMDLLSWLSDTFRQFANVPPRVSQTACISVCKRIHTSLFDLLQESTELTDLHILQMSADLAQCESFVRSQPVPGLDSNMLCLIFADLHQLLHLFRTDSWTEFLSTRKKPEGGPYDRVSPAVAIKLLERMKESEKKRTGFLQIMIKGDRERKKRVDDIIRQLRETFGTSRR